MPLVAVAQIPYYTIVDTARIREVREKKIRINYNFEQPFDSVTGKLKPNAPFDTTYTIYDHEGREIEYSFVHLREKRSHSHLFYDTLGRVVRRFSYDGDSTNGFLDYWTYNKKGQVIREVSLTREGSEEIPYSAERFFYDDSGKLVVQKSYMLDDDGSESLEDVVHFTYGPNNLVVEIGLLSNGDTSYVDSTSNAGGAGDYFSRRYSYMYKRRMVTNCSRTVDTLGVRIKTIYDSRFYNYHDGKLHLSYSDTTFCDRHGNILESYRDRYIDKFFYNDKGEFEYSIRYNRQMQPLYRRTKSVEYYK